MTGDTVAYVTLFQDGPRLCSGAHSPAGDAAADAAHGSGRHLGTFRIELGNGGVVRVSPAALPARNPARTATSRLRDLIAEYRRLTAELDAIEAGGRAGDWEAVAGARCRALDALLDAPPASVEDLHAKFTALLGFFPEDAEMVALDVLADDARRLVAASLGTPSGRPAENRAQAPHPPSVQTGRNTPTMSASRTGP